VVLAEEVEALPRYFQKKMQLQILEEAGAEHIFLQEIVILHLLVLVVVEDLV